MGQAHVDSGSHLGEQELHITTKPNRNLPSQKRTLTYYLTRVDMCMFENDHRSCQSEMGLFQTSKLGAALARVMMTLYFEQGALRAQRSVLQTADTDVRRYASPSLEFRHAISHIDLCS